MCNSQNFITAINIHPLYIPILIDFQTLFDSVSFVCGSGDGTSFCGSREIVVYDLDTESEYTLQGSTLLEWDPVNSQIVIKSQPDYSNLGVYNFEVRVRLADHTPTS